MERLADILFSMGISKYLADFVAAGFLTWDDLLGITEAELESLNVKRGHRRKLQRRIATEMGFSKGTPVALDSTSFNRNAIQRLRRAHQLPCLIPNRDPLGGNPD
jgi:hypothetical protein